MAKDTRDRDDRSIEHNRPYIRLQLFGTRETVQSTIDRMHATGFMDRVYWGQPMPVPGNEVEWVSVLYRRW
ncbi:hypothetical protein [Alkalinema sp. FACHB-956]|uniref:hypothetical protein n=1 Tax=Alkalinema sp. FACHB-956 TaxID=2692768 RepID=UPI001687FEB6|nr:hypothetical protein [Alkalinema sp. FACHB-956]MBD2329704.1 hypothetical protein [Alkalinema sp. FACHB-956]